MPRKDKSNKKEEIVLEKDQDTTPGLLLQAQEIQQSDYDSVETQTLMKDYSQMRNEDAIASSSLEIITNQIKNSKFLVVPQGIDEKEPTPLAVEASEYIQWQYDNLYPSLHDYRHHKNLSWFYGFIMFEKLKVRGVDYQGKTTNIIGRLSPIQHDTIQEYHYDKWQYFTGIQQYVRDNLGTETPINIYADKMYTFTPFSEFNNVTGRSLLRPARRAWKNKVDIWTAATRGASRGAGIPVFTVGTGASKSEAEQMESKAQQMGRTVGNAQNAYVIEQEDKLTFRLEALTNQEHNVDLMNFSNSEMFYNTLSHVAQSGIGQNGSRSATEEHNSPLLEAVNYFIRLLDDSEDALIKDMIEMSYLFGKLAPEEYPKVKRERLKEKDLEIMSDNLLKLVQASAITITTEDEIHLRELFGLPEKSENEIEDSNIDSAVDDTKDDVVSKITQDIEQKDKPDDPELKSLKKGADPVLNIDKARVYLDDTTEQAKEITTEIYNKLVTNVAGQMAKRPGKAPKYRYKDELLSKIGKLYNASFKRGLIETSAELGDFENIQLANEIEVTADSTRLAIKINALYQTLKTGINELMTLTTPEQIENAGGIKEFLINRFKDGNKKQVSGIAGLPATGYTAGRNDNIKNFVKKNKNSELLLRYNASLENDPQNICDVCYPLHGLVFTNTQAVASGLNINGGMVNPNCKGTLGGNSCRCQWEVIGVQKKGV